MAIFIKRVQTVMSLSQLDNENNLVAAEAFGPMSPVSKCPGRNLPSYCYAARPPSKLKYRRVNSEAALAIMPSDDQRSEEGQRVDKEEQQDEQGLSPSESSLSLSDLCEMPISPTAATQQQVVPLDAYEAPMAPAPGAPHLSGDGSLLDTVLTAMWDECAADGLFRYDLSGCSTKLVPGKLGLVAQLNLGRATMKRPTEFRVDQVCQPFDEGKFNFKKAYMREVLFLFEPAVAETSAGYSSSDDSGSNNNVHARGSHIVESAACSDSPNLVIINVSPIEYGHVLLVPRVLDNLPQLVNASTVELALHFAMEADNGCMRVGYNSLGAYATINHLHFQAYYLDADLPCEGADTSPLLIAAAAAPCPKRRRATEVVQISRLVGYPVNGFVVEVDEAVAVADGIVEMAAVVGRACEQMQAANIPHNLLITARGRRVFIWPQCFAEKQAQGLLPESVLDTGVNPAVFEIAGHMLLKRQEDYDDLAGDEVALAALLMEASLPEDRFAQVAQMCFGQPKGSKAV